jgi:arylsulfatase A-like enzyme
LTPILFLLAACAPREAPPSVVLISLDTLRADHLGCYGYGRDTSPRIDAFAATATLYRRAMASAPWTVPSHASMFTGLDPFEHGAHTCKADSGEECIYPLHEEQRTLAEALREAGYRTAAFIANDAYLDRRFQLDQGFEVYETRSVRGSVLNEWALGWLREQRERPFFLFLNYMDTHRVYNTAPRPGQIDPPATRDEGQLLDALIQRALPAQGPVPQALVERVVAQYDTAVANLDDAIGALLDELRALGLYESSAIVLVSDHGEYFGEHHLVEHSKDVYQPALWIPLIVKAPGQRSGREVLDPLSSADLPRLVLSLLPPAIAHRASAGFPHEPGEHPTLSQNYYTRAGDLHDARWGPRFDRVRTAFFDWPHKLIRSSDGRHELYDLERDPAESDDRFAADPATANRLMQALEAWEAERAAARGSRAALVAPAALDDALRERLRALGYLQ